MRVVVAGKPCDRNLSALRLVCTTYRLAVLFMKKRAIREGLSPLTGSYSLAKTAYFSYGCNVSTVVSIIHGRYLEAAVDCLSSSL